jgi:hypothetical protein
MIEKGAPGRTLSPETLKRSAPFEPPLDEDEKKPLLSSSQELVSEISSLFRAAGLKVPSPGQIGVWGRHLSRPALVELVEDLVGRGLAEKDNPAGYVHACVLAEAQGTPRRGARRLPKTLAAGGDESRSRQAAEIARAAREASE